MSTSSSPPQWGTDYVRTISPYVGGRPIAEVAREIGMDATRIVKLASNENPLGMSAAARQAIVDALAESPRYPDNDSHALRQALAEHLGLPAEWIVLGHGSSDILEMAARALLSEGDSCVYSQYGFIVYPLAVQQAGARHIVVPASHYGHDLPAMAAAIEPSTRLVFVANPNNPTGTLASAETVAAFLQRVPPNVVVVLDEAYVEYLDPALRTDSIALLRKHPNLVISRTFSKAYGLAGLRIGYAAAHPALADVLNRVRSAFNTSTVAQAAALAALADTDVAQPLLFAVQVALVAALRSAGIEAAAHVGHTVGEVAAAEGKDSVDAFFDLIRDALAAGQDVKLSNFGNFQLRNKAQRPGRNPRTGEIIPIDARRVVTFHPSQKFKEQLQSQLSDEA